MLRRLLRSMLLLVRQMTGKGTERWDRLSPEAQREGVTHTQRRDF